MGSYLVRVRNQPRQCGLGVWSSLEPNRNVWLVQARTSGGLPEPVANTTYKKVYRLAYWCVKHKLCRAAINEHFSNPTMVTISNFTLSQTIFQRLNKMANLMGINSATSGKVCYNYLFHPNNLRDEDYTHFLYRNSGECIELLKQQLVSREYMLYSLAKEFNNAEDYTYLEVKSTNWWWIEPVH